MNPIRKMLLFWGAGAILFLLALPGPAGAALDTSGSVICAFTKSYECDNMAGCQESSPDVLGLPPFIRIDVANGKVTSAANAGQQTNAPRETAIRSIQEADGKLFLQGIERRGWSAVIDRETGQMTVAASSGEEALVFFGRCTAR